MDKLKSIYASAYSATISIIATVLLTIGMEFGYPTKAWLASFTGHHWITKSWISLISFLIFFIILRVMTKSINPKQVKSSIVTLQIISILGFVVLLGFFIFEFLK